MQLTEQSKNPSIKQAATHATLPTIEQQSHTTSTPCNASAPSRPRVAIVHDWLTAVGGAEKVLDCLLELYPDADVFTIVAHVDLERLPRLKGRRLETSFIQRLPFSKRFYRNYLPLMPIAIEQFDLSAYDLIVSSSYAVAKGVLTGPNQLHVCYCHSPMRYAWDLQNQYLASKSRLGGLKNIVARWLLHRIRLWDVCSANRVDHFIGNSRFVTRRIQKYYRREASVIYPPVDLSAFQLQTDKSDYYVTASRLVAYKRIDLLVKAFANMPHRRLMVIGGGPELEHLRALAPSNVSVLGEAPHATLVQHVQAAKAFLFAAEEDFGIAPVEAQACGTPVIAYGKGGSLESIQGVWAEQLTTKPELTVNPTGLFFAEQSVEAVCAAIEQFEDHQHRFTAENCRANALRFDRQHFISAFSSIVHSAQQEDLTPS